MAKTLYSVVSNPGQDDEKTVMADLSFDHAFKAKASFARDFPGVTFDVMRQLPDGSLTTEL